MFTYLNEHSLPLLDTWLVSLQINQIRECIDPQTVVVCFDEQSLQGYRDRELLHSAFVPVGKLSAGDYGQKPFYFFTYVKHEMIAEALKVVQRILYFDVLRYQREMELQWQYQHGYPVCILFNRHVGLSKRNA